MIIIYLNKDAFAVNRALYLSMVEEAQGDWVKVTSWVESVGTYLGSRP